MSVGEVLPSVELGQEKARRSLLFLFLFRLQSVKADDCFAFSGQTLGLVLLCCSVTRRVIYPALNEIGLITE